MRFKYFDYFHILGTFHIEYIVEDLQLDASWVSVTVFTSKKKLKALNSLIEKPTEIIFENWDESSPKIGATRLRMSQGFL